MMNANLLPTSSPSDTLGAYAVLGLIADPVASKKRLDELVKERVAADTAFAQAKEENLRLLETKKQFAVKEGELAAARADLAKRLAEIDIRERDLADLEGDYRSRCQALSADRAAHEKHKANLDVRMAAMTAAEANHAKNVNALEMSAADLDRRKREFDETLAPVVAAARLAK